jgi:hypothetical protein
MAAATQPVNITTFKAGGTIRKYRFVTLSAAGTVTEAGANAKAIGIHQGDSSVSSGEFLDVALSGGGAKLEVGEAIAINKFITSTASGQGEVTDTAGNFVGAIAFEAGATSGDVIGVRVVGFTAHASDA